MGIITIMKKSEAAQLLGRLGGNARAKNSTPAQRRKWAKKGAKFGKLGGRPKGTKNKKGS
jgi:hypothetical protein